MAYRNRWLKIREAADRACCTPAKLHRAVKSGHLRAARKSGNGELVFLESWIDEWLANQLLPENDDGDLAIDVASLRRELSLW